MASRCTRSRSTPGFTCPNRDGSKGIGGCTFCNNQSFSPGSRDALPLAAQLDRARGRIVRGTGARLFIAYFQAYTNTYAHVDELRAPCAFHRHADPD